MVSLEKVAALNPWWAKGKDFAYSDRDIQVYNYDSTVIRFDRMGRFSDKLKPGSIIVLKGPRRVGKTLLLKLAISALLEAGVPQLNIFYFSFDTLVTKKELDNMLSDFLRKPSAGMHKYIMLDEVQNVGGWEEVLKARYDAGELSDAATVVTGSMAHLFRGEMLPGRGIEGNTLLLRQLGFRDFVIGFLKDIHGKYGVNRINKALGYNFTNNEADSLLRCVSDTEFSLEEDPSSIYEKTGMAVQYAVPVSKLFDLYLHTGGYPIGINSYLYSILQGRFDIDARIYEELYNYAKQDATIIGNKAIGNPAMAGRIMGGVLANIGNSRSNLSIAKSIGINTVTVMGYLERIENSYVFESISGMNRSMELMKKKKFYFSDILLHYSCGAASEAASGYAYTEKLLSSSYLGTIVEEIISEHIIRSREIDPMEHYSSFLYFYNEKTEIDFIYKRKNGSYAAIESKYRNSVQTSRVSHIKAISDCIVLSKDMRERVGSDYVIPVHLFTLLLSKSASNL